MNFKQIVELFISGATEGKSAGQGNLQIKGDLLVHYMTTILERYDGCYILNNSRYSIVTGRLQKQIKELIPEEFLVIVTKVPVNHRTSLVEFIETN